MEEYEEDFNEEEDTSTDSGQSEENESGEDSSEFDADYWKKRAEIAERDRDNYKEGLLSKKSERKLSTDRLTSKVDVSEDKVATVLDKRNEQIALTDVVDKSSDSYIPELENDAQYNEIIGYLPRNLDKSTPQKIVKALKIATKLWKEDRGLLEKSDKKDKSAEIGTLETTPNGNSSEGTKPKRTILKGSKTIDDWYN